MGAGARGPGVHGTSGLPRRLAGLALIAIAILLFVSALPPPGPASGPAGADKPDKLYSFTLKDIDGNTWYLKQFRGEKVVLIDLMAIPCESCKIVEQNLKAIYPKYKDDVFFISVDVWSDIDTEDDLRKYDEDHQVPWPIALDTDDLLTKYDASTIAKVIIVDYEGYAVFQNTGVTTENTLKKELDRAIAGKSDPIEINEVSLWMLAVFAGVASFFSPCAFPMFPGYMAFYFKKHIEMREETLNVGKAAAAGTVSALGIIVVYLIIGGVVTVVGAVVAPYVSALQLIIGIILLILGSLMMTNLQYDKIISPFRALGARLKGRRAAVAGPARPGEGFYAGLFVYGAGYGGAAAACTLPVFLAVILAGMNMGPVYGILLVVVYTLVAAFLMIGVTVAIAIVGHTAVQKMAKYTNAIKKISGFVLLLAGIYLVLFWLAAAGYITIPGLS